MLHIRFIDERRNRNRRFSFDVDGGLEYAVRRTVSPLTPFSNFMQAIEVREGGDYHTKIFCPFGTVINLMRADEHAELYKRLTLLFPMLED